MIQLFLLSPVLLLNCSTGQVYSRNELVDQILKPRKGFPGMLTNRSCKTVDPKDSGKCSEYQIDTYDLNKPAIRKELVDLQFVCIIGDERFHPCLDQPGFCRFSYKKKWFLGKEEKYLLEYKPLSGYQFLIDSGMKCMSRSYR